MKDVIAITLTGVIMSLIFGNQMYNISFLQALGLGGLTACTYFAITFAIEELS